MFWTTSRPSERCLPVMWTSAALDMILLLTFICFHLALVDLVNGQDSGKRRAEENILGELRRTCKKHGLFFKSLSTHLFFFYKSKKLLNKSLPILLFYLYKTFTKLYCDMMNHHRIFRSDHRNTMEASSRCDESSPWILQYYMKDAV